MKGSRSKVGESTKNMKILMEELRKKFINKFMGTAQGVSFVWERHGKPF